MPYIKVRRQSDGSTRYTAIVRLRSGKTIVHQEAKTFAHRSAAVSWAKHREVALENPGALALVQQGAPTVAELVRWYIDNFETVSKWQRSKQAHLEFLERHALGKLNALTLKVAELLDHVRSRRAKGAGPATVANDLIWLGVVLRAAKNVRELPVRPEIVKEAREACSELRLTGKARKRARRPTADELARLRDYFARRDKRAQIPMLSVMEFALTSARREAEICRLQWKDNDEATQTGTGTTETRQWPLSATLLASEPGSVISLRNRPQVSSSSLPPAMPATPSPRRANPRPGWAGSP